MTKSSNLLPMSALKLNSATGLFRNFWHLLLLVPAFLFTAYVLVDLVFITRVPLPVSFPMLGFVVLGLLCIRNAFGCVRYWASFLWLGLFLMAAATFCSASISYHQIFNWLAYILLFVFFWNLGRFDRRVILPLLLFCGAFTGVVFYRALGSFNIFLVITSVCFGGFLALYGLSVFLALSARELPGFRWLVLGLSLSLLTIMAIPVFLIYFTEYIGGWFLVYIAGIHLLSLLCIAVGASIFTLKMDPVQLEEMLRKATPAKEVESVN